MCGSLNKVQIIGYLGLTPKPITTKDGSVFYSGSVATNERINKSGRWEQITEWHQLLFFGKFTKACAHLHKGSYVYIEGKLRNNVWHDVDGNQQRQANVIVTKLEFLDKKTVNNDSKEANSPISPVQHLANIKAILGDEPLEDSAPF